MFMHCTPRYLKQEEEESKKVLLVAGDIYRPAAIDQLISLGKRIEVSWFTVRATTSWRITYLNFRSFISLEANCYN